MKILKIIFPLFLISFFFIPKVNASTTTYKGRLKYDDSVLNLVETYSTKLNNLRTYLSTHCLTSTDTGNVCMNTGKYLVAIDTSTMSSQAWNITVYEITQSLSPSYNTFMTFYWRSGNDYNTGAWNFSSYGSTWRIIFLSNNIRNYQYQSYGGQSYSKSFSDSNGINPMVNNINVVIDNQYFDTYFLNDNLNIDFRERGTPFIDIPLYNGSTYVIPQINVDTKTFFDSFIPIANPYACILNPDTLGTGGGFRDSFLSNISDFTTRVYAYNLSSDDEFGFEGSYALYNSNSSINSTILPISFNNDIDNSFTDFTYTGSSFNLEIIKSDNSVGDYNVNGTVSWDNTNKAIIVNYSIFATGSIEANPDLIFKISPTSNDFISFFEGKIYYSYCNPTNPDSNSENSYGYTDKTTGLTNSYDSSLMNFLNNNNSPDLSFFSRLDSILPSGPLDNFLTIPLKVLNELNNSLNGQCSPKVLTLPYLNSDITLPCLSSFYSNVNATNFVNYVGTIGSTLMLIQYFTFLYNWFEDTLLLSHKKLKTWGTGEVD